MKSETEKIFEHLNPEQKEAVMHFDSPLLILAGAGSGKTRVITTKIAYLIKEKNVPPSAILAVTFTKKAANEMYERAIGLEKRAEYSVIKTFHSFGAFFLRRYAHEAGLAKSFTVYDDDDSVNLLMKAIPSLRKQEASLFAHKISLAKDYALTASDDLSALDARGDLQGVYEKYESRLRETGNVDFGDLILLPKKLMNENEMVKREMQNRFRVILVDEYQDSNAAQFELLQTLSGVNENAKTYVCVVGDDDQSIYKFRGAEIQNILTFKEKFPNTKIIKLVRNYRSTAKILSCANEVVKNNFSRLGKTLQAERGDGKRPLLVFLDNQDDEASFCASLIQNAKFKTNAKFSEWAILYRTNAQSLSFEKAFSMKHIPYKIVGSLKFYEREEIKDALSFLSLLANDKDELAFRRIVNKPARGIGEKTQDEIVNFCRVNGFGFLEGAEKCTKQFSKKANEGLQKFISIFKKINEAFSENENLSHLIETVSKESGLREYHTVQDEIAGTQKVFNLDELANSAVVYDCTMEGLLLFLDTVTLEKNLENENAESSDAVTLITVHNTKGLEFPRVIITGMENGIFPRDAQDENELEEERRLFYVGITRAQNELYVTSCRTRRMYGRFNFMRPSVFLDEAGETLYVLGDDAREKNEHEKWVRGVRVYHDEWGSGEIISVKNDGQISIVVQFESGAKKIFMPAFQKNHLTIIQND